jgi:hypothetical protein
MRRIWRGEDSSETMKTNAEAVTTQEAANVAAQSADVAPSTAPSKRRASQKKGAHRGQQRAKAAKLAAKPEAQKKVRQSKATDRELVARAGTAKAKVIAMLQRKDGATLDEIMKATGWMSHTVRGFISLLGSKDGLKIERGRRDDGAWVYAVS